MTKKKKPKRKPGKRKVKKVSILPKRPRGRPRTPPELRPVSMPKVYVFARTPLEEYAASCNIPLAEAVDALNKQYLMSEETSDGRVLIIENAFAQGFRRAMLTGRKEGRIVRWLGRRGRLVKIINKIHIYVDKSDVERPLFRAYFPDRPAMESESYEELANYCSQVWDYVKKPHHLNDRGLCWRITVSHQDIVMLLKLLPAAPAYDLLRRKLKKALGKSVEKRRLITAQKRGKTHDTNSGD